MLTFETSWNEFITEIEREAHQECPSLEFSESIKVCGNLVHPHGKFLFAKSDRPLPDSVLDQATTILGEIEERMCRVTLANIIEHSVHEQSLMELGMESGLLDLVRDSTEWQHVQQLMGDNLELIRVQRVHNEILSDQYVGYVNRMAKKPGFSGTNERVLFHGTARTDPKLVCLSGEGFDPRLSRHGNYGVGSYFSSTPNYSAKNYAYTVAPSAVENACDMGLFGEEQPKQIIIARVACGNVYDMGHFINQSLTRPPPLPGTKHTLYDCVQGGPFASRSSEMCMVVTYDKAQALPDYLVSFKYRANFEEANKPQAVVPQTHTVPMLAPLPMGGLSGFGASRLTHSQSQVNLLSMPLIQTPRSSAIPAPSPYFNDSPMAFSPELMSVLFNDDSTCLGGGESQTAIPEEPIKRSTGLGARAHSDYVGGPVSSSHAVPAIFEIQSPGEDVVPPIEIPDCPLPRVKKQRVLRRHKSEFVH